MASPVSGDPIPFASEVMSMVVFTGSCSALSHSSAGTRGSLPSSRFASIFEAGPS
ncbi:hypothetical protein [Amycolatopsis coloradensis]|uniref:hypothetical protein n=1 Tax=Amycolatopsis coloradensis TaxID=76021 RepID=UPI001301312D|nr:hypothetical protein [Amycolatopsis coloradensis]